jgi:hypothetical protein
MRLPALLFVAAALRLAMLFLQRSIGMEWDFHIDATYYVDGIFSMKEVGIQQTLNETGYENFFYTLVGYLMYSATFGYIESQNLLISLNLLLSIASVAVIYLLYATPDSDRVPLLAIFFACSPYLAHLSVHPLKDSVVLFCSLTLMLSLSRDRWLLAMLFAIVLVLTRYHLGILTVMLLVGWRFAVSLNLARASQALAILIIMGAMFFGFNEQLSERLDIQFEGREFYPEAFALVPDGISARFFLGGFFNFLVPFPFIPARFADIGYFAHWAFFLFVAWMTWRQASVTDDGRDIGMTWLMMSALFLFSFVLTTTPGAGPLVRYRLFAELLFLIALGRSFVISGSKQKADV